MEIEKKKVTVSLQKIESNEIKDIDVKRISERLKQRKQSIEARSDLNSSDPTYEPTEESESEEGENETIEKEELDYEADELEGEEELPVKQEPVGPKMTKFEAFLAKKQGNQEDFWRQRGVRKRLGPMRAEIEALETAACNNNGDVDMIPRDVFRVARAIGVSPEMILDHIGNDVLFARKLNKEKKQVTPNGMVISLKVRMD